MAGAKYAELESDQKIVDKITDLEKDISKKTGKDVVLVAFSE